MAVQSDRAPAAANFVNVLFICNSPPRWSAGVVVWRIVPLHLTTRRGTANALDRDEVEATAAFAAAFSATVAEMLQTSRGANSLLKLEYSLRNFVTSRQFASEHLACGREATHVPCRRAQISASPLLCHRQDGRTLALGIADAQPTFVLD
jgi:hypothetical protein